MTELNPTTDAQPATPAGPESADSADSAESAEARIDWPAPVGDSAVGDPAVDALLMRLGDLPEMPAASHVEVYAGLHDDLAAALNEDVAGQAAGDTPR